MLAKGIDKLYRIMLRVRKFFTFTKYFFSLYSFFITFVYIPNKWLVSYSILPIYHFIRDEYFLFLNIWY